MKDTEELFFRHHVVSSQLSPLFPFWADSLWETKEEKREKGQEKDIARHTVAAVNMMSSMPKGPLTVARM